MEADAPVFGSGNEYGSGLVNERQMCRRRRVVGHCSVLVVSSWLVAKPSVGYRIMQLMGRQGR